MHEAHLFSFATFFSFLALTQSFQEKKVNKMFLKMRITIKTSKHVSSLQRLERTSPKLDFELALDNSFVKFLIFLKYFLFELLVIIII